MPNIKKIFSKSKEGQTNDKPKLSKQAKKDLPKIYQCAHCKIKCTCRPCTQCKEYYCYNCVPKGDKLCAKCEDTSEE